MGNSPLGNSKKRQQGGDSGEKVGKYDLSSKKEECDNSGPVNVSCGCVEVVESPYCTGGLMFRFKKRRNEAGNIRRFHYNVYTYPFIVKVSPSGRYITKTYQNYYSPKTTRIETSIQRHKSTSKSSASSKVDLSATDSELHGTIDHYMNDSRRYPTSITGPTGSESDHCFGGTNRESLISRKGKPRTGGKDIALSSTPGSGSKQHGTETDDQTLPLKQKDTNKHQVTKKRRVKKMSSQDELVRVGGGWMVRRHHRRRHHPLK